LLQVEYHQNALAHVEYAHYLHSLDAVADQWLSVMIIIIIIKIIILLFLYPWGKDPRG